MTIRKQNLKVAWIWATAALVFFLKCVNNKTSKSLSEVFINTRLLTKHTIKVRWNVSELSHHITMIASSMPHAQVHGYTDGFTAAFYTNYLSTFILSTFSVICGELALCIVRVL